MALEVVWTKRSEAGYAKIVDYLETHFTEKELQKFVRQSQSFFELLSEYPEILESTKNHKYVHRGPINKNIILTYRIKPRK